MTRIIANLVVIAAALAVILVDRKAKVKVSPALWIPTIWMLIVSSRSVSAWLNFTSPTSFAERYSDSSPVDAAIFGFLILAALFVLNSRAVSVKAFVRSNYPLVIFFGYCALSILWSDHSTIALKRWIKAAGDLVMVLVVLTDPAPVEALKRILSRMAFLLLPLSAIFIVFFPDLGTSYDPVGRVTMYIGVTQFKNELGMTSMICGLGSLWNLLGVWQERALDRKSRKIRQQLAIYSAMLALAVGLIVRADSMTSLSGLMIVGAVMVMTTVKGVIRHQGYRLALVSGAIAFAFFAVFLDTAGTLVGSLGRNATLTGRTQIWAAVLSVHTNPLIGTGFESFWLGSRLQTVWDMSQKGIQEAHNGYLEIYLNLGWIGLLLLGSLVVTGYGHAIQVLRTDLHAGRLRLAFLAVALIFSFTEAGFRMMSPVWFAFLLAITAVPLRQAIQQRVMHIPLRRPALGTQPRILQ